MPRHLDLSGHEATITVASVNIRVLSIGQKQMTLAVFRQLVEERLIDQTGQLSGLVWGRVNYFWGDCINDHLHVVWQTAGEDLRRACVYNWDHFAAQHPYTDAYWSLLRRAQTTARKLSWAVECTWGTNEAGERCLTIPGLIEDVPLDEEGSPYWDQQKHGRSEHARLVGRSEDEIAEMCARILADLERVQQADEQIVELETQFDRAYAQILAAPQLFIAV